MRIKKASPVIFIVGPTAIGKTPLSIGLAGKIKGEIISADSMQAYKSMPILSQAPSSPDRKKVRHHLAGFVDPAKEYSAAIFRKKALEAITDIQKRRKVPIVVGGSGLYIKALVDGLFPSPEADMAFRKRMSALAAKRGSRFLHAKLSKIDSESASKIHPNDLRRIIRALEIYHTTGRTMTGLKSQTCGIGNTHGVKIFALTSGRQDIYDRINARVDDMFDAGAVDEVRRLKRRKLSRTAAAVLGLKEISGYLDGRYAIDQAREMLKMNTRRFAKRQLSWFRADERIVWFDVSKVGEAEIIEKMIRKIGSEGWVR
jgi:tRNA dimethylallyltransferase